MTANPRVDTSVMGEDRRAGLAMERDDGLSRRSFLKMVGAGVLISVTVPEALGQRLGGRRPGSGSLTIAARVHIGKDGAITVMTGKIEAGQGARAEMGCRRRARPAHCAGGAALGRRSRRR